MFLHTSTFKKLLKSSWKNGGITVGRLDPLSMFVTGDYWATWFDYTSIPNRIRAAIIEYAGELPEIGEIFKAKIDEPNQYEMPYKDSYDVHKNWQQAKNPLIETPVIVSGWHTNYRLFQDSNGRLVPVTALYDSLIDRREQEENEGSVIGPSMVEIQGKGGMLYWYSDLCILGIMSAYIDKGHSLKAMEVLSAVDFHEKEE